MKITVKNFDNQQVREIELPEEAGATYGGREETEERRDPFRSHGRTAI